MGTYKPLMSHFLFLAVVAALLVGGLAPAAGYTIVRAASPSIALQPTATHPGDVVLVKGQGFNPNSPVTAYATFPGSGGVSVATSTRVQSSSAGTFSASLAIPTLALTTRTVVVAQGPSTRAQASLLVEAASLHIGSGSLRPGQQTTLTGRGFGPNETVNLSATFPISGGNRTLSGSVRTNSNGQFTAVLTVPTNAVSSPVTVTARGPNATATARLTVVALNPRVNLQPAAVRPGQTVQVTGNGFTPNSTILVSVTFALNGGGTRTVTAATRSDAYGNYRAGFAVPSDVASSTATVVVTDSHTRASNLLTIQNLGSSIAVSPASVSPGSPVEVTGTGFLPGERVDLALVYADVNGVSHTLAQTPTAASNGSFRVRFDIPSSAGGGTYTITARSERSRVTRSAIVSVSRLNPAIVVSPSSMQAGRQVTVSGSGFAPNQNVAFSLNGRALGSSRTDASGRFSLILTIPSDIASGSYDLLAQTADGRRAAATVSVARTLSAHFYFPSIYTGPGYHEYLAFLNPTNIPAQATITYQRTSGVQSSKTITVQPHSRFTEDVNADLGGRVSGAARVDADVPIAASRMVYHNLDASVVPGVSHASTSWYFANGNTGKGNRELLAIQNPNGRSVQVALRFLPSNRASFTVYRTVRPTSRMTVKVNSYVKRGAVGLVAISTGPVVIDRTQFVGRAMSSTTGSSGTGRNWYFAAGPRGRGAKNWLGLMNPSGKWSYVTIRAYGGLGRLRGQQNRWLRPNSRVGILINKLARGSDVAVQVSSSQGVVAEQMTYVGKQHRKMADSFGVTSAHTSWAFSAVNTIPGQSDTLIVFNPTSGAIAVVAQFMTDSGQVVSRSFVVNPFNHLRIGVGGIVPRAYLGVVVASDRPFVPANRITVANGNGASTSNGIALS